jgi:Class III cytochrome C family.
MKTTLQKLLALTAILVTGVFLGLPLALSQEDMRVVAPRELQPRSRPPAVFVHDKHNENAKLDDCAVCHHGKDKDGRLDKEDMSAGTPCVECHAVNADTGTPLKRAYHRQCVSCHTSENRGPTYCGGCHRK